MRASRAGRHEQAVDIVNKAINFGRQQSQYNQNRRLSHLTECYRRLGRYEKAIDTGQKLLDSNPNNQHALRAYISLTCAYTALGSEDGAREAAAEVLRLSPNFSIEAFAIEDSWYGLSIYGWFLKHEDDKNLLITALRKAGLQ